MPTMLSRIDPMPLLELSYLESTRGCKDLRGGGTSTFFYDSALALAKGSSQRTVPYVQIFGRIRQGRPDRLCMYLGWAL
jgi:hypothetical protein